MLRVRGNNKPAGGTKFAPPAPVCNVILRRYSLLEVPRRRIHNAIAHAMSICVAVGNKVMDTRLPQPVGCGDKYDVCSAGRSMIEMLGVLAIVGVLSVGGIAGYSKAMEKFKVDKAIGEYSQLIIGLMEHKNSLSKLAANQDYGTDLADFVEAANLVPQSWKKVDSLGFNDAYGNRIHTYTNNSKDIAIDFYLGGYEENEDSKRVSKAFNTKVCEEIFNNMAKPLQSSLKKAWLWGTKVEFYGNSYCCPNCKCLNKLTLSEIHQACNSCIKDTFCAIVFWF